MRETMADLASDSPYYSELNEVGPDCGRRVGYTACAGRPEYDDDYYGPDNDTDDDAEDED
jgi:hypothetical protein